MTWCSEKGITNSNTLTGRDLYAYRIWRREGGYSGDALKTVTLRSDLSTLRAFLRFCGKTEDVKENLHDQVPLPKVNLSEDVSNSTLDSDRAIEIVNCSIGTSMRVDAT